MGRRAAKARGGGRSVLEHRNLVLVETVLLVGLLKEAAEDAVLAWTLVHPLVRVALGIALVVGAFGSALVVFEAYVHRGLERTHEVVRRLPIPLPLLAIHGALLVTIFAGYAWYWDSRTGAVASLWALAAAGADHLLALVGGG